MVRLCLIVSIFFLNGLHLFLKGIYLDSHLFDSGLQFHDFALMFVIDVFILFFLFIGEIELSFQAEELPLIIIDGLLHLLFLLHQHTHLLLQQCHHQLALLRSFLLPLLLILNDYML